MLIQDRLKDKDGFSEAEKSIAAYFLSRQLSLEGESILDLFRMTPYAWKTPREGVERLEALEKLEVTAAFRIHVFRRL